MYRFRNILQWFFSACLSLLAASLSVSVFLFFSSAACFSLLVSLFCSDWSLCLSAYYSLSAVLFFSVSACVRLLVCLSVYCICLSVSFFLSTNLFLFFCASYLSLYISMSVCFLLSPSFCSRFSLFASDYDYASLYICLLFFLCLVLVVPQPCFSSSLFLSVFLWFVCSFPLCSVAVSPLHVFKAVASLLS